jgi:type I restriction enzyme M protein
MLSPQLRNKVHNLWTMLWSAGMTNPLVAIEQITYLLFLRQLERLDNERVKQGKASIYDTRSEETPGVRKPKAKSAPGFSHVGTQPHNLGPHSVPSAPQAYGRCRWSYIRQNPSFELLNDTVFPWLRGLEKRLAAEPATGDDKLRQVTGRLDDAYFVLDPNKTDTLARAVLAVDELFRQLDSRSANADIMGDIFEHLLGEIEASGKNGQFRTPRHIIRFMVQLLDPPPGARILDPACGSGGFLVNTLLHWRAKTTDPETLRLEWDGTPHRAFGDGSIERLALDTCFTGYDNDRTMVRIGWMNLILHGLEFPHIEQRDSLSKRMPDSESASYDFILANPPFTGSVDEGDLSANRQRFPAGKGNKPITTKSEILFVWLLLDLLKVGGRAAVVVPDGVLFGSTNAHRELRRQLLFENTLEGVISLPAGVFLPYAGVKTSILVFQKAGEKVSPGADPRTREVWFYEVEDEAYTLDQKRKERPGLDNDLWDALAKFARWRERLAGNPETTVEAAGVGYTQPDYWRERWRPIDGDFLKVFPGEGVQRDQVLGLDEIFRGLPANPEAAQAKVEADLHWEMQQYVGRYLRAAAEQAVLKPGGSVTAAVSPLFEKQSRAAWNRLVRLSAGLLDREYDQFGFNAAKHLFDRVAHEFQAELGTTVRSKDHEGFPSLSDGSEEQAARHILTEFAKLDGYDVWRRSSGAKPREAKNDRKPQLSWIVPVRVWASLESWGEDPKTKKEIKKPTHDGNGLPRPEYLKWLRDSLKIFDADGTVKEEFCDRLDPACIEAADFILSASRHRPFTFEAGQHRPPAEVIRELDGIHGEIRCKLGKLLALVEGAEEGKVEGLPERGRQHGSKHLSIA